jgi:hypothetical protein
MFCLCNDSSINVHLCVDGALLWSMGKIFRGAEVTRIYVGSYSDDEIKHKEQFGALFDKDRAALISQLQELPGMCCMRKVNEMVKRIRLCVVHACMLGHLRSKMPLFFGGEATRTRLIANLPTVFEEVRNLYHLSEGDFPSVEVMRGVLQTQDFYTFPPIDRKTLNKLQEMLTIDIPRIIEHVSGVSSTHADSADTGTNGSKGSILNIFHMDEEDEKHQQHKQKLALHSQQTMIIIIGTLVVVLAVIIASIVDNHKTAHQLIHLLHSQYVTFVAAIKASQAAQSSVSLQSNADIVVDQVRIQG